jgi:hypothetical protein
MLIDALRKPDPFKGWTFHDAPSAWLNPNYVADIDDVLARHAQSAHILRPANWVSTDADDIHYRAYALGTVRGRRLTLYAQRRDDEPVSWVIDEEDDDDRSECIRCHDTYPLEHFSTGGLCLDCFDAPPEAEGDE